VSELARLVARPTVTVAHTGTGTARVTLRLRLRVRLAREASLAGRVPVLGGSESLIIRLGVRVFRLSESRVCTRACLFRFCFFKSRTPSLLVTLAVFGTVGDIRIRVDAAAHCGTETRSLGDSEQL
jgi:hypothetical protein